MSDISVKLLNYATVNSGKLKLYTELNSTFNVGDTVYISDGYYKNTNELLYVNNYSVGQPTLYTPFTNKNRGYKIISIDIPNNGFTIDYDVILANIVYPYGTTLNPFGNPQDATNLAYNTYTGDDLYKGIYVSNTAFVNGTMKAGTINNGIFGNDKRQIKLGANYTATDNLTINHIISKNVKIDKATINSKVHPAGTTKKIKVIENNLLNPANPFYLAFSFINPDNNGFGYSIYEKFENSSNVIINNGEFINPRSGFINLSNLTITKAKIGSSEPVYGCNIDNITINDGIINNVLATNNLITNNVNLNTFVMLNQNGATWSTTPGNIIFNVIYDTVANKKWVNGTNVYISGIQKLSNPGFDLYNTSSFGTIVNTSYTFGNLTSATIEIHFDNLNGVGSWPTYTAANPINQINFSYLKVHFLTNNITNLKFNNGSLSSCLINATLNDPKIYLDAFNITEGYYKKIIFSKNGSFNGLTYGISSYITESIQIGNNLSFPPVIKYVYLVNNKPISGLLQYSKMISGVLYNSSVSDSIIDVTVGFTTYLDDVTLNNNITVDPNVIWNDVSIQYVADTVVGVNIVTTSSFANRKTPWVTHPSLNNGRLQYGSNATNINKISENSISGYYNAQQKIDASGSYITKYSTKYEVPSFSNIVTGVPGTDKVVLVDRGPLQYDGANWTLITPGNKLKILFADILDNNPTIKTKITNRTNQTTSGTYTDFPGVALQPTAKSQVVRVDNNYVYTDNDFYFPSESITQKNITANIYSILSPSSNIFPSPTLNDPLVKFFLRITNPTYTTEVDNAVHGGTSAIREGLNYINFRRAATFTRAGGGGDATSVPACFVEIERVITTKKNLSDVVQSVTITNCNHCVPITGHVQNSIEYSYDNIVLLNDYPTDYIIRDNIEPVGNPVSVNITSNDKFDISVEFWVTWFYDASGFSGYENTYLSHQRIASYRTKHTLTHTLTYSADTNYITAGNLTDVILTDTGDKLYYTN